jgi:hypothetical protein
MERLMNSFVRRTAIFASAISLSVFAIGGTALAAHGKPGLWQVSVRIDSTGMPKLSPAQMAQMRAMGIRMPMGNTITTTHCMTAAEVAMDKIPAMTHEHEKYCSMQNMKSTADSMSADLVCTGKIQGGGHLSIHFDSPEHYAGQVTMNPAASGHPVKSSSSFDARWLSADCKAVQAHAKP